MKILILGALDEEIAFLLKHVTEMREIEWNGFNIYEGVLFNNSVVICKSKVGKVFSALITQHLLDTYKFDFVLFTGVAGSLKEDLNVGDVVVASELFQHDMDCTGFGWKKGQIPYTDYIFLKTDDKLLNVAKEIKLEKYKVVVGRIATGDQFVDHNHSIKQTNEYDAFCVDMEGASVSQVCTVNKVPFLIIRVISDNADDSASGDFIKNLPLFANNSFEIIKQILSCFSYTQIK